MTESDLIIFATSNHPSYELLKKSGYKFYDVEKNEPFEEKRSHYTKAQALLDCTLPIKSKKKAFLKNLSVQFDIPIISDLSCYWGEALINVFPKIVGAVNLTFLGPTNSFEYYAKDEASNKLIAQIAHSHSKKGIQLDSAGMGFIFPRTISMIINEAYFALEEELASREDIDKAMKNGVNYPMGPFQWCRKIGADKVCMLLDELYYYTKDGRYKSSRLLRLEAIKINPLLN